MGDLTRRTTLERLNQRFIYARIYALPCIAVELTACARVPRWSPVNELTHLAATRFVWTAVILDSSESSGPLSNGRILKMKMYSHR